MLVHFLLFALPICTAIAQVPIQTNLIGYWKLDGTYADRSPGHRDLTPVGGISFGTGVLGQGVVFPNDSNQYLVRQGVDDAAYDFGASDFTIALWVKFAGLANNQVFIEKWVGPSGPGWTFAKHPDNSIVFNASGSGALVSPVVSLTPGVWYHFAVVRSTTNLRIFLNNTQIAFQAGYVGAIDDISKPLLIGRRDGTAGFPMAGNMDEVGIWSRALSSLELTDLYTAHQMICGCMTQASGFAGGTGTSVDPYFVCSPLHLDNVRNHLSSHFVQTADIDMTGVNFMPIGSSATPFTGNFDGDIFQIMNLEINQGNMSKAGLFSVASSSGTIAHTHVVNASVTGKGFTAGLVAENWGLVSQCSFEGDVHGVDNVGGLIAANRGIVTRSSSRGSVNGTNVVGGLVAQAYEGSIIYSSYSRGSVTASGMYAGGLVAATFGSTITNTYATGTTLGGSFVGRLVGFEGNSGSTVSDSFWNIDNPGPAGSVYGTGKTTIQLKQEATFNPPWDFANIWQIDEGNDYPVLRTSGSAPVVSEIHCADDFDNDCDSLVDCEDPDCASEVVCLSVGIPAVSTWGMVVLALLILVAGILRIRIVGSRTETAESIGN